MSQPTPWLAPSSTASAPSFLDVLLHKGILSLVLHHLPTRSSLRLSEACRTLCHHVRAELQLSLALQGEQGRHLVRLPPSRTFSGAVQLTYTPQDTLGSMLSLTAALRHAALKWPRLHRVVLDCGGVQRSRRDHVDGDDLVLVGPLALLSAAPQLRQLRLVPRTYSPDLLESLGCLTQLTQLSLGVAGDIEEAVPVDLRPLTSLTNLLELEAGGIAPEEYADDYYPEGDTSTAAAAAAVVPSPPVPQPAAAAAAAAGGGGSSLNLMPASPSSSSWPCLAPVAACLPASLTRLDLALMSDAHSWVPQLAQCSRLQQLSVHYSVRCHHWSLHPCALQAVLGPRLAHLTQLTCSTSDDWVTWEEDYAIPPDLADLIIGNELEVLLCEGLKVPVGPYLPTLPQLASFRCDEDLTLAAASVEDWYHLAACTSLRHLRHLTAGVAPPPDMKPLGLTSLSCWVADDSGWLVGLLRHTPALQRLQLNLTDGASLAEQLEEDPASSAAIRATCARLTSLQLINDLDERLGCCQALLTCFPSLLSLELDWVAEDSHQLPDLRGLTGLTHLALRAHAAAVQEEDVLSVMWHCTRLASLQVEGVQGVTPRLALMLQHQLPALCRLELVGCGQLVVGSSGRSTPRGSPGSSQQSSGRSEQDRMEQLRQLLRPGLELVVHGDWSRSQEDGPARGGPADSGQGHSDRLAFYLGSYDDI